MGECRIKVKLGPHSERDVFALDSYAKHCKGRIDKEESDGVRRYYYFPSKEDKSHFKKGLSGFNFIKRGLAGLF